MCGRAAQASCHTRQCASNTTTAKVACPSLLPSNSTALRQDVRKVSNTNDEITRETRQLEFLLEPRGSP
eukprot:scaffold275402_cov36-Tisochrysis_lutea.AAC.4